MSTIYEQLAATPLCRTLDASEVARVVEAGRVENWPAGSVIMEEGSSGPRLVILLEGTVHILKRDEAQRGQRIAEVGPGAVLGEMSLLLDAPRTASVHAATPLRLFAMDRRNYEEMVADGDPAALKVGMAIARVLALRVEELNKRVVELVSRVETQPPLSTSYGEITDRVFSTWDF
jgi:CRP/FNR family cyclic AMP-dependent transcriptional regulator